MNRLRAEAVKVCERKGWSGSFINVAASYDVSRSDLQRQPWQSAGERRARGFIKELQRGSAAGCKKETDRRKIGGLGGVAAAPQRRPQPPIKENNEERRGALIVCGMR